MDGWPGLLVLVLLGCLAYYYFVLWFQYNLGACRCDENEKAKIQQYCDSAVTLIKAGKMLEAFNVWDEFLNGDVWPYGNYFHNITGSNDYDNFLNTNAPASFDYYAGHPTPI